MGFNSGFKGLNVKFRCQKVKKAKWSVSGWTNVVARAECAKKCLTNFYGGGLLRDLSVGENITKWLSGCERKWYRLQCDRAQWRVFVVTGFWLGHLGWAVVSKYNFSFLCLGGLFFESCQRSKISWQGFFYYFPEFL